MYGPRAIFDNREGKDGAWPLHREAKERVLPRQTTAGAQQKFRISTSIFTAFFRLEPKGLTTYL